VAILIIIEIKAQQISRTMVKSYKFSQTISKKVKGGLEYIAFDPKASFLNGTVFELIPNGPV
jgi:hypothetical protein